MLPHRDVGLVLQGTDDEEGVTNAVMASAPGHPVWAVLQRNIQRTIETDPVMDRELGPKDVIRVSGPQTMAKAFRQVFHVVSVPGEACLCLCQRGCLLAELGSFAGCCGWKQLRFRCGPRIWLSVLAGTSATDVLMQISRAFAARGPATDAGQLVDGGRRHGCGVPTRQLVHALHLPRQRGKPTHADPHHLPTCDTTLTCLLTGLAHSIPRRRHSHCHRSV